MCNKIFFRNTKRRKYAKYTNWFALLFSWIVLTHPFVLLAEQETSETSPNEVQKNHANVACQILQKSIDTLLKVQSYKASITCDGKIRGQFFGAKGEYCQKRYGNGADDSSALWEMQYNFSDFSFHQCFVLNGEAKLLWTLSERWDNKQKEQREYGIIHVVNLVKINTIVTRDPLKYSLPQSPWQLQPHISEVLQGILQMYEFRKVPKQISVSETDEPYYQLEGQLKQELVTNILNSHGIPAEGGLMALPPEIPMYVQVYINAKFNIPRQICFYSNSPTSTKKTKNQEDDFSFRMEFEVLNFNDVSSIDKDYFNIPKGYETYDVTEKFLEEHLRK